MKTFIANFKTDAAPRKISISGLRGSACALFASRLMEHTGRPVMIVSATEELAAAMETDLALFCHRPIFFYPGYDIPPYTPLSPDPRTVADRLATLYRLLEVSGPFALSICADALLRRIPPREILTQRADLVLAGEETDPEALTQRLLHCGYEPVSLVQNVGEFSHRGGIVDIFPTGFNLPVRLDFFGDTVESIRLFDPISQRSRDQLDELVIVPVSDILLPAAGSAAHMALKQAFSERISRHNWQRKEANRFAEQLAVPQKFPGIEFFLPLFYQQTATVFSYLPPETIILHADTFGIGQTRELVQQRIAANFKAAQETGMPVLPPEEIFLSDAELSACCRRHSRIYHTLGGQLDSHDQSDSAGVITCGNHNLLRQEIALHRKEHGLLGYLAAGMGRWLAAGDRIIMACRSEKRAAQLQEFLHNYDLTAVLQPPPVPVSLTGTAAITLYPTPLSEGFDLATERLHVLSENELFGDKRLGAKKKTNAHPTGPAVSFDELAIGDIVVHASHGLGRYQGLVSFEHNGVTGEYLHILYKNDDILYVPVDRLHTISKYKGIDGQTPKLDRLGGKSWLLTKSKVKEAVWQVAVELLDLYAKRQLTSGTAFSQPDTLYEELEESFPYDETPGQQAAINDVLDDLTAARPMDRLVCGDVGYGKTEVAVRGAFKVIADSYQVAMLVPTTVLAEQHAQTFKERFAGLPVRVECLDRFRTQAEQKKIVQGLADGSVDMVIGTHRLLSRDIHFNRLGLLIIDEEHRFGVRHKEKIKKLRHQIDVLTLTATPIPRTLQLSLLGIRDLSVISTPPARRRSVKTFVARYDELVIKEAISRELARRGQVFVVHNRVHSIPALATTIQQLVPNARVAVAHGQMPGRELESIMVRFVRHEIDVLVCTTIIESGLDIPNANTIIITRADRLGLAEIYQLRGRVGRGREQAYAYLLMPSLENLGKDASRRLRALMDYNELGGGFKLAMSDLQIRGGGNILGESQSGNIAAVGYDLYLDLLQKTIDDLKRKKEHGIDPGTAPDFEPEVNCQLTAHIPATYISDLDQRYFAYRKLTGVTCDQELAEVGEEFRDRYGRIPPAVENLFAVISLKLLMRRLLVEKVEYGRDNLVFHLHRETPIAPEQIVAFIEARKEPTRLSPHGKLILSKITAPPAQIIEIAKKILRGFLENAT